MTRLLIIAVTLAGIGVAANTALADHRRPYPTPHYGARAYSGCYAPVPYHRVQSFHPGAYGPRHVGGYPSVHHRHIGRVPYGYNRAAVYSRHHGLHGPGGHVGIHGRNFSLRLGY